MGVKLFLAKTLSIKTRSSVLPGKYEIFRVTCDATGELRRWFNVGPALTDPGPTSLGRSRSVDKGAAGKFYSGWTTKWPSSVVARWNPDSM